MCNNLMYFQRWSCQICKAKWVKW